MNIKTPEQVMREQTLAGANTSIVTIEDYDAAAEERLMEERTARGYTTREPTDYALSTDPVWKQDAADWSKFRDDIWHFAIEVSQQYASTGIIPYTLDEFKAKLKEIPCVWTYNDAPVGLV